MKVPTETNGVVIDVGAVSRVVANIIGAGIVIRGAVSTGELTGGARAAVPHKGGAEITLLTRNDDPVTTDGYLPR